MFDWKAEAARAHETADKAYAEANPTRVCSKCSGRLTLTCLRRSQLWIWAHNDLSDCEFSKAEARIKFRAREDAINAEKVFQDVVW